MRNAMEQNLSESLEPSSVDLSSVFPALLQCFGIILLGHFSSSSGMVTETACQGMHAFVSFFSLPAMVFVSLSALSVEAVSWEFLAALVVAKIVIFAATLIGARFLLQQDRLVRASLYAIFVTQSNDFALGYPILEAVFGGAHPQLLDYVYLMAPVSFFLLNPIAFLCIETDRSEPCERASLCRRIFLVIKKVFFTPIVFMTFAGMLANATLYGRMPKAMISLFSSLASAFSASSLFLLGVRMGTDSTSASPKGSWIVIWILTTLKLIVMPLMIKVLASSFLPISSDKAPLESFALLYGLLPPAPTVFVFASLYSTDISLIASSLVISTMISAPLLFLSSQVLTDSQLQSAMLLHKLEDFTSDVSGIGLVAAAWVLFLFVSARKRRGSLHLVTMALVVCQGVACLGALLWSRFKATPRWGQYIQVMAMVYGVYASRINSALLAVKFSLVRMGSTASPFAQNKLLLSVGLSIPALLVLVLAATTTDIGRGDPLFPLGPLHVVMSFFVLTVSLGATTIALVMAECYGRGRLTPAESRLLDDEEKISSYNSTDAATCITNTAEKTYSCHADTNEPFPLSLLQDGLASGLNEEVSRHFLLLLLLAVSMFVGLCDCVLAMSMNMTNGVFVELGFLDCFANYGQSLLAFILFGLDLQPLLAASNS